MSFPASIWPLLKSLTFIAGFCAALSILCTLLTANHLEVGKVYCRGKGPFSKPPFVFFLLFPPRPANTLCSLLAFLSLPHKSQKSGSFRSGHVKRADIGFFFVLRDNKTGWGVRLHLWDNDPFIGLRVLLLNYSKHTTSEGWDPPWGNSLWLRRLIGDLQFLRGNRNE